MTVTVAIVNYRTSDQTARTLRRTLDANPGADAIVVDNSDDEAQWRRLERELSPDHRVSLVRSDGNVGFAAAVNHALGRVERSWALLLNPDVADAPDISELLAATGPDVAAVGGLVVDDSGLRVKGTYGSLPTLGAFVRYALPLAGSSLFAGLPGRQDPRTVGWVSGACMLVSIAAWRDRSLDESLFMYAEDIDFCWAQALLGRRVVLQPRVRVGHRAGGSSGGRPPLRWAVNLALVSSRYVAPAPVLLALGLAWRGLAAFLAGRPDHAAYLLRSSLACARLPPRTGGLGYVQRKTSGHQAHRR